ncbi:hypothetical protein, partial [Actinomycetospora atypica]
RGSLALASWTSIAAGLGLTLLVPDAARAEALLAGPGDAALLNVLLAEPTVLVLETPEQRHRLEIDDLYDRDGVFDPLASWVVELCRTRGWPALSSDPDRLRRLDPAVEVDLL